MVDLVLLSDHTNSENEMCQPNPFMLRSNTLETKCIKTSIYNVLANHDQNLESRFKLFKVCLVVKLESSDCRIY